MRQLRENGGHANSSNSPDHDATLLDRLCQASSKRQRQFAYWQDHSRKLSAEMPSVPSKQAQTQGILELSRLTTGPSTIFSGTEATSIQAVDHDAQSLAPSASTARGLDGTRVPLPKAPKLNDGQAEFQCPYCYVWCPVSERRRWRKHLFEDLRPYMCTYLDCSTTTELFATRAEWLAHDKRFHLTAWKCRYHPSTIYASQKNFEDHLRSQHASMTDREIEASVKYSMTTLEDTRVHCCICLVTVSQLPRGQSLTNHMAHHFEKFARPSLPDHSGEDDDVESQDSESTSAGDEEPVVPQDADSDMPKITSDDFEDAAQPENMSIHALAVDGNKYGMRVLLEQQPDLNARDDEGWTALQRAAYAGQGAIVQMLLGAGADLMYSSGYYGNALRCAALQGHEELVRSLIDGEASVNQQGGYHGTALLAAVSQGHETTVEILLEAGARIDLPNDRHISAIHAAMHYGHVKIAQRLGLKVEESHAQHDSPGSTTVPQSDLLNSQNTQPPWRYSQALGGDFIYRPHSDEIILKTGTVLARPQDISVESLQHARYEGSLPVQYHENRRMEVVSQDRVEVVFQKATASQIGRREPAREPKNDINKMSIDSEHENLISSLFPAFKVRTDAKRFFSVGRIFLVLWSEPVGAAEQAPTRWEAGIVLNHLGERAFSKVRSLVVIQKGPDHCYALPITTYGGRGVSKPGVVKSDHVIIYSSRFSAHPLQDELPKGGEAGMRPVPIQVVPDSQSDTLDPMSRLNLGGITMVQHSVKAQPVGKVCRASIDELRRQFESVWGRAIPASQGPALGKDSDGSDDDDYDDDDEEEDDDSDEAEVDCRPNAQVAQPTNALSESGAAFPSGDEAAQVADSATAIENDSTKGHPAQGLVEDKIAHYRLTEAIIERELLTMFPTLSSTAFNIEELDDYFTFHVPQLLTSEQKYQIFSKRVRDLRDNYW